MIILLYGPDDYRREEKKHSIKEEFLKKYSGLSVGSFDFLEKEAFEEFKNFVKSQSIFETKKIVFVENAFEERDQKGIAEIFASLLENKNTTMVISEKGKPLKAFSFLLEKSFLVKDFPRLESKDFEKFISAIAKEHRVNLEAGALAFLARAFAGNSWGAATEIQKLSLLGKSVITQKDLEGTMIETLPDFWAVINSLKNPDIRERLFMIERLFAANEPAAKIFNVRSATS